MKAITQHLRKRFSKQVSTRKRKISPETKGDTNDLNFKEFLRLGSNKLIKRKTMAMNLGDQELID